MTGFIYKITNTKTDNIYIGSTIQKLSFRFKSHKSNARLGKNGKLYDLMRSFGIEHFSIELLEECNIKTESDLCIKEKEYYEKLSPSLNMIAPRIPENHDTARIYKLFYSLDDTQFYIGSTRKEILKRLADHRSASNNGSTPVYTLMREHGRENFDIECVEDDIPIGKLIIRENYWINELKPPLNKNTNLCITEKERDRLKYIKNREKRLKQVSERLLLKRDEINAQKREYYASNKETIAEKDKKKRKELQTKEITLYNENPNFTKSILTTFTVFGLKEIAKKFGLKFSPKLKPKLIEKILETQDELFDSF